MANVPNNPGLSGLHNGLPASRSLALLLLIIFSPLTHGFGADGHKIVGELAFQRLHAGPRNAVVRLLDDEGPHALAKACNWPDAIKSDEQYQWSLPLHYVNLPRGEHRFDRSRDCPDRVCVIGAIERYSEELGNLDLDAQTRANALKFVCHFVGDLHQPMHTGYADDRGGNRYQVSLRNKGSNLHSVWDTVLVDELGPWEAVTQSLQTECQIDTGQDWKNEHVMGWFDESRRMAMNDVYPPAHKLDEDYVARFVPVTAERLCLAGKRLAWMLNSLLSNQP
jgi:hypothetical protein